MSSQVDTEATRGESKINFDTILLEVGQFGKYQMRTAALCAVLVIFMSWATSEYVFTTSRINSRCFIPECESDLAAAEYAPQWILNAVPGESIQSFDNCQRYVNSSAVNPDILDTNACSADLFDKNTISSCKAYVYETKYSVVYDLDLACDEWRRSLIGSIRTLGEMLALPLTGFLSDRWGRRTALVINAFNTMWIGTVRYWASSYYGFMFSEFFEAVFGLGGYSCVYILLPELVGSKYRVVVGAIISTSFSVGLIFLGLISWVVSDWRTLTLVLYVPQVIVIAYYWLISESIRWYMSKGRYEEYEKVVKILAKTNGKDLSAKSLKALTLIAEEEKIKTLDKDKDDQWLIVKVFRHKKILLRCIVSPVWWVTCILIYYGLSLNSVSMSGNSHLNFMAVAAAEIPGHWASIYLMEKIGRKPVLICSFWFCAACLIGFVFIPHEFYGLSLTFYLTGVCSNAMVVIAVYVYTAEIYPTKHRHSLFAFSSMIGRTGNIIAPLTPAIGAATFYELPFLIFAGLAFLSGCLVFLTPETFGTKLPDTYSSVGR